MSAIPNRGVERVAPREHEEYRALVAAVIDRAISDASGHINGLGGSQQGSGLRLAVIDGLDFLFSRRLDAWLVFLSLDPDVVRAGLIRNPRHAGLRSRLVRYARSGELRGIDRRWVEAAREAVERDLP